MLVILFVRRGKVKKTSVTVMFFTVLFVYKLYLLVLLPDESGVLLCCLACTCHSQLCTGVNSG